MAKRHMKRCSRSLITRKMQIEMTLRYHLIPVRRAIISKSTNSKCCPEHGERGTLMLLTGAATVENSMEFPQNLKMGLPFDPAFPLLEIYPKNHTTPIRRNICIPVFIAALFTVAKIWKQPKCTSAVEWIKNCGTFTQWNTTQL